MKRRTHILTTLLCAVLLCTACAGGEGSALKRPNARRTPVELILGKSYNFWIREDEKRLEKLQGILDGMGSRITVSMEDGGDGLGDIYLRALEERLVEPNVCAVVSQEEYLALADGNLLGDIETLAREQAPVFFQSAQASTEQYVNEYAPHPDRMPLAQARDVMYFHTAVLVRQEIAQAFGQEVDTFSDYMELLRFCAAEYPQYCPGLLPTEDYMQLGSSP